MEPWVWSDNFFTGTPHVDQQHQIMVDLINELGHVLHSNTASQDVAEKAYARLIDYTRYHFQDEENLMVELRVDDRHMAMHCGVHAQFVAQLQAIWERRHMMDRPGETLMAFLTSWLSLHIFGVDMSLSRQICLIENGTDARRAFEREGTVNDNGINYVLQQAGTLYQVLSQQNIALAKANQGLEERLSQAAQLPV